jgi:hypothetical protein
MVARLRVSTVVASSGHVSFEWRACAGSPEMKRRPPKPDSDAVLAIIDGIIRAGKEAAEVRLMPWRQFSLWWGARGSTVG